VTTGTETRVCKRCKIRKSILSFAHNKAYTASDTYCLECRSTIYKRKKEDAPPVPRAHPMYGLYREYLRKAKQQDIIKQSLAAQTYRNAAQQLAWWVYVYCQD
jgi:hypothetical protein